MSRMSVFLFGAAVLTSATATAMDEATYIIDAVNGDPASTWTAGYDYGDWDGGRPTRSMGAWPRDEYASRLVPVKTVAVQEIADVDGANEALAEAFDARERWPECSSLLDAVKDQSNCGSCWAVSAASVFSDRLCVATGGAVTKNLSAEHLNSCCYRCGKGCDGGLPEGAWNFFVRHGVVTGGDYGSREGCQPYSIYPCGRGRRNVCAEKDSDTPECSVMSCTNVVYANDYMHDLHYVDDTYMLPNTEEAIMTEIYEYGPVQAIFYVYTDFFYYKSGIYQHMRGKIENSHAIKILGWGVENGVKYWLCANSWSRTWGENGKFRILKGNDECGIESRVLAGLPHMPSKTNDRWGFETPYESI